MRKIQEIIEQKLQVIPVTMALTLPSGESIGPHHADIHLTVKEPHLLSFMSGGNLGAIGDAIVQGTVEVQGSMRDLMTATIALMPGSVFKKPSRWMRWFLNLRSKLHHSQEKDAEQIQFHYDVSNDFYALWLDPRRVYSCAYWQKPDFQLAQAQEAKLDLICRKLDLKPNERFLDIGAGWGGLLLWAAEHYDVHATGITLSRNQYDYVQQLVKEKGLAAKVHMHLLDYRALDEKEQFDKIASVGMFEHVGRANLQRYFQKLYALLRPGGLLLNHGITSSGLGNTQVGGGMGEFIEKYIFPGGELVHVSQAIHEMAVSNWEALDVESLRPHYAKTLWAWSDALESQLNEAEDILKKVSGNQHAAQILRAYRLYLAGCAMAFEQNWVSLYQILASRPSHNLDDTVLRGAQSNYPFVRDYIYTDVKT